MDWTYYEQMRHRVEIDAVVIKALDEQRIACEIGEKVKHLRRKVEMTQQELAAKVGSTQSSVARFEAGRQARVSYAYVQRLLEALGG